MQRLERKWDSARVATVETAKRLYRLFCDGTIFPLSFEFVRRPSRTEWKAKAGVSILERRAGGCDAGWLAHAAPRLPAGASASQRPALASNCWFCWVRPVIGRLISHAFLHETHPLFLPSGVRIECWGQSTTKLTARYLGKGNRNQWRHVRDHLALLA
jgi:hypothetical protein